MCNVLGGLSEHRATDGGRSRRVTQDCQRVLVRRYAAAVWAPIGAVLGSASIAALISGRLAVDLPKLPGGATPSGAGTGTELPQWAHGGRAPCQAWGS